MSKKDEAVNGELVAVGNGDEGMLAPALLGDNLLMVARQAEARVEAVKKIKSLALRVTNCNDWIDEHGKPYLQVSGSEKVARLFGISWRIGEPAFEQDDSGHYRYTYQGEFQMGDAIISAIGTRSSSDAFFSEKTEWVKNEKVKVQIRPEDIDRADVKKGAYTNCIGNGITRLLGIRNLTWEELEAAEISRDKVTSIQYKKGGKSSGNSKSDSDKKSGSPSSKVNPSDENPDEWTDFWENKLSGLGRKTVEDSPAFLKLSPAKRMAAVKKTGLGNADSAVIQAVKDVEAK